MISLCMIVKNEEKAIEKCLSNIKKYVDEIVIIDTGSTDNTKQIALKYTDKVYAFKWCNDFSKARNFSISKASHNYILILDADEYLQQIDMSSIKKFCENANEKAVGRIERINEYEDKYGIKKYIENVNRLFSKKYFEYKGIIHEQLVSKTEKTYDMINVNLQVYHSGYNSETINRTNKIKRNIALLKSAIKENSDDPYLYYQLGKSYFMDKKYKESKKYFEIALSLIDNFYYEYVEDLVESYGYSLINLNLFNKALNLYKYEQFYSKSPDYLFLLAIIEMNNGNFQKSVETFLKCTEHKEGKIEGITTFLPLYNIGIIFDCLGFKDEALKYYEMCGNYEPAIKRLQLYNI